ncbi:MAG: hypothetical protein QNL43_01090 [Crocinitomicaceae bacterium]
MKTDSLLFCLVFLFGLILSHVASFLIHEGGAVFIDSESIYPILFLSALLSGSLFQFQNHFQASFVVQMNRINNKN